MEAKIGKRSNFERRPMDDYATIDPRAVAALVPHLRGVRTFHEPCVGHGILAEALEKAGLQCLRSSDITDGNDALEMDWSGADVIITNPPWTRDILHPMIRHFQSFAPTWLLFDAGWIYTKQSAAFVDQCSHIVAIGRLRWVPEPTMTGKDDCSWYRFHAQHSGGPKFVGREVVK